MTIGHLRESPDRGVPRSLSRHQTVEIFGAEQVAESLENDVSEIGFGERLIFMSIRIFLIVGLCQ